MSIQPNSAGKRDRDITQQAVQATPPPPLSEPPAGNSPAAEKAGPTQANPESPPSTVDLLTPDLAQTWLAWQCRMISGLMRGALYLLDADGQIGSAITTWPVNDANTAQLDRIAAQARATNKDMALSRVQYGPDQQRVCDLLACPILVDNKPFAIAACSISTRSEPQQRAILQLMRWGGLWLETLSRQQSKAAREHGAFTQQLLIALFTHTSSHAAVIEVVNGLAKQLDCERVSLGLLQEAQIRLRGISHIAHFDHRSELIRKIEAAMEEAVDQASTIVRPARVPDLTITRAHDELSNRQAGVIQVCTVLLPGATGPIGALTFEREGDKPFDQDTRNKCEALGRIIGPALELKLKDERPLWAKAVDTLQRRASSLVGTNHLKFKLWGLAAVVLIALLALVDGNYAVTAPANIEAASRQVLVAPQDGYIKKVELRAGDLVSKGQLIATLDDRSLLLERQKWQSEYRKIDNEYQQALATRDRAQITILQAQREQALAEQQLVEDKLARTQLLAPFDGVIVSGDLSQSLGAPVTLGQVLYEVAPIDSFRVALELNEYDMDGLEAGKTAKLLIAALPQKPFDIVLDQVIPVAISAEGRNFFRIEATLTEPATAAALQAGMRGVAKVDMGKRKLLWIWTHAVVDRVRMWLWSAGL